MGVSETTYINILKYFVLVVRYILSWLDPSFCVYETRDVLEFLEWACLIIHSPTFELETDRYISPPLLLADI